MHVSEGLPGLLLLAHAILQIRVTVTDRIKNNSETVLLKQLYLVSKKYLKKLTRLNLIISIVTLSDV